MGLFGKKPFTNVAVIDVHSSSVGAGYVSYRNGVPTLVSSVRLPLEPHATEPMAEALARTLDLLMRQLVTQGAPALRAYSGTGKTDFALAAIAAPWQHSQVFSHTVEKERPFVFTKSILAEAIAAGEKVPGGLTKMSDMLIATLLNGYEVENPYGRRAKRAELILLSSSVRTDVMQVVRNAVRKGLHQHRIHFNAYLPEAYNALRDMNPQQRDFMAIDIGGEAADIVVVKHGLLISLASVSHGVNGITRATQEAGISSPEIPVRGEGIIDAGRNTHFASRVEEAESLWLASMQAALAGIAQQEPLPRMIFLCADDAVRDFLRRLLDVPQLRALWLTEDSLGILPVIPQQFAPHFGEANKDGVDPVLGLLALAARHRLEA